MSCQHVTVPAPSNGLPKANPPSNNLAPTDIPPTNNNNPTNNDPNVLVVPFRWKTSQTCLTQNASTPGTIDQYMNKRMDGRFTWHPITAGTDNGGPCGTGTNYPMHADVGGKLFAKNSPWVPSCFPDRHYIRNDKVCINKCVKIEYKGKTLTIPIMNETEKFEPNELDITEAAFKWLEPNPNAGLVAAKITYIECPSTL